MANAIKHDMSWCLGMGGYDQKRYGLVTGFFEGLRGRLLDVGCHKGGLRKFLPPTIEYVGVDLLPEAFPGAVRTDLNDASLPFADESFDAATCTAVLEHVFHPLELLLEIARVLRPEGRALFSVPNDRGLLSIVSAVFLPVPPYEAQVQGHHWRFSRPTARALVEKAFEIEREAHHFGPHYNRSLPFLKFKPLCTELFMFCRKKPRT